MPEFGTVRRDGDFGAVHFDRVYDAAPADLWDAWTSPARIPRWLGASLEGSLEVGATARLVWGEDPDSQVELQVNAMTPPRLLEWQWTIHGEPPTLLRVELTPVGSGTRLVLDHSRLPANQFAGLSSGWHDFLDVLGSGVPSAEDRWRELLPAYQGKVAAL
ncbi:MAG TPA: SRPBCC domain-containing protein [Mycobacteriales bacterium]|nr:SRPBCC domain-containing protein [Mycobacteriales bacterium]